MERNSVEGAAALEGIKRLAQPEEHAKLLAGIEDSLVWRDKAIDFIKALDAGVIEVARAGPEVLLDDEKRNEILEQALNEHIPDLVTGLRIMGALRNLQPLLEQGSRLAVTYGMKRMKDEVQGDAEA